MLMVNQKELETQIEKYTKSRRNATISMVISVVLGFLLGILFPILGFICFIFFVISIIEYFVYGSKLDTLKLMRK